MKKGKKLLGLILALSMVVMLFAGCTTQETALMQALGNSSKVKSLEAEQTMKFNIKLKSGGTEQEKQVINQLSLFNGVPITAYAAQSNESDTKGKMYAKVSFMGMGMDMWVDADASGSMPAAKEIFKITPSFSTMMAMAGNQVPSEVQKLMAGKQYMVLDTSEMLNDPEVKSQLGNMDIAKIQKAAEEYSKNIMEIVKKINFDTGKDGLVQDKGTSIINIKGQDVSVHQYQIAITDASLKELIINNVNTLAKDTAPVTSIVDATLGYMNTVLDASAPSKTEADKAKAEMTKAFNDFKTNLPQYAAQIQKATGNIDKIKLLGDKGIKLDFYVDNSGNIVRQTEDSSYIIDMAGISALTKGSKLTGVYEITVNSIEDIYNINKKVDITLPTLTNANSFTYMDFVKVMAGISQPQPQPKPDPKPQPKPKSKVVKVVVKKATMYKGYAATNVITTAKGKITNSKGTLTINVNGHKAVIKVGAKSVTVDNKKYTLKSVGALNVKGRIFLSPELYNKMGVILVIR